LIGFDIDGVLAEKPPASDKAWGKMNGIERKARKQFLLDWYRNALPLYPTITEPFIAISARKDEIEIQAITRGWLAEHYPLVQELVLLPMSRSIENVVRFKSAALVNYQITEFTEDNKKVLKGIAAHGLDCQLWFWEKGMPERIPFSSGGDNHERA
jgi:hypothetical protein